MDAGHPECKLITGWERSPEWKLARAGGLACIGIGAENRGRVYAGMVYLVGAK